MELPTSLTLEVVTPDRAVVTEQVDEVRLPGSEGSFGVLPGHAPLLAALQVGEMWYRKGQETHVPGPRVRLRRGAAGQGHRARARGRAGRGDRHLACRGRDGPGGAAHLQPPEPTTSSVPESR